ncbi:hypothetical protein GCM10028813_01840 [Ramlibacter alkalitolerans]|nr:1-acyl-sn-glycerol-3-phosphate acyltransferase [Ramlibacter alkalitolerans]
MTLSKERARALFKAFFRIEEDLSAIGELQPGTLLVANHVSFLDGLLVAAFAPTPCVFGVDSAFAERSPWKWGLRALEKAGWGRVVALDTEKPFGMRELACALKEGETVCLFPQGAIRRELDPVVFEPGVRLLQERAREVIGVYIGGAGQTLFGRSLRRVSRLKRTRISLSTLRLDTVSAAEYWLENRRRMPIPG